MVTCAEKEGPLELYKGMVAGGMLQHDARQESVARALDQLLGNMREHEKQMKIYQVSYSKQEFIAFYSTIFFNKSIRV
jgi:hypothetical protein